MTCQVFQTNWQVRNITIQDTTVTYGTANAGNCWMELWSGSATSRTALLNASTENRTCASINTAGNYNWSFPTTTINGTYWMCPNGNPSGGNAVVAIAVTYQNAVDQYTGGKLRVESGAQSGTDYTDAVFSVWAENISTSNISYVWCYQEFANVSTACGGLSTGTYFDNGKDSNWRDGDWATATDAENTWLYVNYTKPSNATNESLFMSKMDYWPDGQYITNNGTINPGCWNNSKLVFRGAGVTGDLSDDAGFKVCNVAGQHCVVWECQNSSGSWLYVTGAGSVSSDTAFHNILEEAMWWRTSNASSSSSNSCTYSGSSNWNISCADNCVLTTNVNMNKNNISVYGTGTLTLNANISNISLVNIKGIDTTNICRVTCSSYNCFKLKNS